MALFRNSLWPAGTSYRFLRLVTGLVAAPVIVCFIAGVVAFVIAGMSESNRAAVMAIAEDAAVQFLTVSAAFTATVGLIGVVLLWAFGQRSLPAWLTTGGVLGALAAALPGLAGRGGANELQIAVAAVLGTVIFALVRWIAGIRR